MRVRRAAVYRVRLNLSDEVDAGFQCGRALFPFRRADLAVVRGDELGRLDLAQQFVGVAADGVVLNFGQLYLALGIDDEGAAIGLPFLFVEHTECAGKGAGVVSQHGILDFLDGKSNSEVIEIEDNSCENIKITFKIGSNYRTVELYDINRLSVVEDIPDSIFNNGKYDEKVLILSSDTFANPEDEGVTGAPGRRILTFSVVGPGRSGIRLGYKRPWERNSRPARVFQLLVFATGESPAPILEEEKVVTPRVGSKGQIVPERKGVFD